MDEDLEYEIEEERRWLKREFGENDELFKALHRKLKKNLALQGELKKEDDFLKICPDCKGEGVIYIEYPWYMFPFNPIEKRICHKCKGKGKIYTI